MAKNVRSAGSERRRRTTGSRRCSASASWGLALRGLARLAAVILIWIIYSIYGIRSTWLSCAQSSWRRAASPRDRFPPHSAPALVIAPTGWLPSAGSNRTACASPRLYTGRRETAPACFGRRGCVAAPSWFSSCWFESPDEGAIPSRWLPALAHARGPRVPDRFARAIVRNAGTPRRARARRRWAGERAPRPVRADRRLRLEHRAGDRRCGGPILRGPARRRLLQCGSLECERLELPREPLWGRSQGSSRSYTGCEDRAGGWPAPPPTPFATTSLRSSRFPADRPASRRFRHTGSCRRIGRRAPAVLQWLRQ